MDADEARERLAAARVARLATAATDGRPHLVPITFALAEVDTIVTAVDHKPKRTRALRRLANIRANPRVALLADEWSEDWSRLWWARADGLAMVLEPGDAPSTTRRAVAALAAKYPQYVERPPAGSLIVVDVRRWSGWRAAE